MKRFIIQVYLVVPPNCIVLMLIVSTVSLDLASHTHSDHNVSINGYLGGLCVIHSFLKFLRLSNCVQKQFILQLWVV